MLVTRRRVPVIGLTGGIASGKSTVVNVLRALGAYIIDADEIVHQVQRKGQRAWQAIVEHFGSSVVTESGELDRRALGEIIFSNPVERECLNRIVHPIVIEEIERQLEEAASDGRHCGIVVDVPLLYEAGMEKMFDQVWVVSVSEDSQLVRLMARNDIDRQAALARIRAQMPIGTKTSLADRVIDNDGTVGHTRAQIEDLWREITVGRNPCTHCT
ncbi:MAG: dephospho-CoA kinase [Bacillota bacterium]